MPCSRAAHLEYPNNRRYRDGWDPTIHRNYKRFAEVWLDDYKQNFYDNFPQLRVSRLFVQLQRCQVISCFRKIFANFIYPLFFLHLQVIPFVSNQFLPFSATNDFLLLKFFSFSKLSEKYITSQTGLHIHQGIWLHKSLKTPCLQNK